MIRDYLTKLAKDNANIIKIVKFIPQDNGEVVYTDHNGTNVCDAQPVNGEPIIRGIRVSIDGTNINRPKPYSFGIVAFTAEGIPFILQVTQTVYTRNEVRPDNTIAWEAEGDKTKLDIQVEEVNVETSGGGAFRILNGAVVISEVGVVKIQVINEETQAVVAEIIIKKDEGISLTTYNNTPIEIKNNELSLLDVLEDMIRKFQAAVYVSQNGCTGTISAGTINQLNEVLAKLKTLLK